MIWTKAKQKFHRMSRERIHKLTDPDWIEPRPLNIFVKSCQVWYGRGLKGLAVSRHKYMFLDRSVIANVLTNQWRLASEIKWIPRSSWLMTFFNSFSEPSMAVNESQLVVIVVLPRTKHGHFARSIRGHANFAGTKWWSLMANSRSLSCYSGPSITAFWQPTRGRGNLARAKYDNHWKSTRGHRRISGTKHGDLRWPIRGQDGICGDQAWPPLTVNSWSSFGAQSPRKRMGWVVTGVVGSLLKGRDASSFALSFSEAVVSLLKDTWYLEKWHVAFNAWVAHLSSLRYVTFHFI